MSHRICENIKQIEQEIGNVQLVVVSKYRSLEELTIAYDCGHRNFGENRVQETLQKYDALPKDINWHIIGHLQRNKVKYIAPFVHLIHSVDSLKLLEIIDKEAQTNNRIIDFLFQIHIAQEESKYGMAADALEDILLAESFSALTNVRCKGLMGMASLTEDNSKIASEFLTLKNLFHQHAVKSNWDTLSMGMSGDYNVAIECGSNMIRVGSKIFQP